MGFSPHLGLLTPCHLVARTSHQSLTNQRAPSLRPQQAEEGTECGLRPQQVEQRTECGLRPQQGEERTEWGLRPQQGEERPQQAEERDRDRVQSSFSQHQAHAHLCCSS